MRKTFEPGETYHAGFLFGQTIVIVNRTAKFIRTECCGVKKMMKIHHAISGCEYVRYPDESTKDYYYIIRADMN